MMVFKQENISFTNDLESSIKMTLHNDQTIGEVFQEFRRFLLACGYSPEIVNTYVEPE